MHKTGQVKKRPIPKGQEGLSNLLVYERHGFAI